MCMEDIRIMRRTDPEERIISVGNAAAVQIVPQDRHIVAITLDNQGAGDVTVSMNPAVVSGNGLLIQKADPPLRRSLNQDGNAITRGLYAIAAPATTAVVVVWISYLQEE
jgi:hypothetical protein